jgi:hypothetical protein
MKNWLGAILMGLVLTLFAAPAAMAFADSKPVAAAQDGDGKGKKKGKKHGKKKHHGKKRQGGKKKGAPHRKHHRK